MAYTIRGVEPASSHQLAEMEAKIGPSNFLRTMAHRPEGMRDFMRLYGDLMGPAALVDHRIREMVYLAVSRVNECAYCIRHHSRTALEAGISQAELRYVETENDSHFSMRERAALQYARELTRNASVGDDTRYRAQELFSTDEIVELTMIIGLANFTNRFNNGLAVQPES
ncbi:MAG TPA: carboxymuconolactone decarboxylase family protein [Bryobacteraceae bacterium]|jgi:uncharacterized peroxidase-related enzyme|nr:carboxymuconolactone decarboxylase family protein [Bryobacteraceae bacterium]